MGYRHYFYRVSKEAVNHVKGMDVKQLAEYAKICGAETYEEDDEIGFSFNDKEFMWKEQVFEFGKLYHDDTAERIYSKGVPLFEKPDVQEKFSDYVPFVVGKEAVHEAIAVYKKKVKRYYSGILKGEDGEPGKAAIECVKDKLRHFSFCDIADTDESNKWIMTGSWEYEYSLFNLVHILKTMDWEQDTLLFYGW